MYKDARVELSPSCADWLSAFGEALDSVAGPVFGYLLAPPALGVLFLPSAMASSSPRPGLLGVLTDRAFWLGLVGIAVGVVAFLLLLNLRLNCRAHIDEFTTFIFVIIITKKLNREVIRTSIQG